MRHTGPGTKPRTGAPSEAGPLEGGSAALWAGILEQVNPVARVIIIDITDHTQQARQLPIAQGKVVLAELRAYAALVDVGGYLIPQDTGMWEPLRNHPGGWRVDAAEEFLREDSAGNQEGAHSASVTVAVGRTLDPRRL